MKLFAYYSTFNIPLNHEKNFTKIYVFSTKKNVRTTFIFCFENFFSSTTKHDNVFFAKVKISVFLQLFYTRETSKMITSQIICHTFRITLYM